MERIDTKITFDDVNALINELEAQFGKERMLPKDAVVPNDCSIGGCTVVAGCCGTSVTE